MEKNLKLYEALNNELKRQREHVEFIASENFVSEEILNLAGTVLTNKYAEGYPGKRYYGGCEYVDVIENLAINSAKKLFKCEHVNVQPHSGSQANAAAYAGLLNPGDKILGMGLSAGGHLTHGYGLNFSGKIYKSYEYGVDQNTHLLNYDDILKLAKEIQPKLIVAGASAYSQIIDFKKFREIADSVNAYLMVDMAHIAGLVATGLHPSPIPYADVVTSTTHKTLKGPRGGLILCKEKFAKKIDSGVFPGNQGGPLEHIIAAKAVCFDNAATTEYKNYMKQVVINADAIANKMQKLGYQIISGGTKNHLILIETKKSVGLTGKEVEDLLFSINITINKNSIPFDTEKPYYTSGIRLGSAAMTSRGLKAKDFEIICEIMDTCLRNPHDKNLHNKLKQDIINLLAKFPLYPNLKY